jgi:hypothetical protein
MAEIHDHQMVFDPGAAAYTYSTFLVRILLRKHYTELNYRQNHLTRLFRMCAAARKVGYCTPHRMLLQTVFKK